jgi:hypothetical protein
LHASIGFDARREVPATRSPAVVRESLTGAGQLVHGRA